MPSAAKVTTLNPGGAATGEQPGEETFPQTKYDMFIDRVMVSYLDHLIRLSLWNMISEILKFGPKRKLIK